MLWRDVTEGSQAANEEWDWIEVKEIYLVIFIVILTVKKKIIPKPLTI